VRGLVALVVAVACAAGCELVTGFTGQPTLLVPDGGPATTGSSSTGTAPCTAGETMACYDGPMGTEGVGACMAGKMVCQGGTFGACTDEVTPKPVTCASPSTTDVACLGHDNCVQWGSLFGDSADQVAEAVAVDAAGNVIVVGSFYGTIALPGMTLTAFNSDAFVIKLGPDGKPMWGKSFGAAGATTSAKAVAVDTTGNIAFGGTVSAPVTFVGTTPVAAGIYLATLSGAGDVGWAQGYTQSYQSPSIDFVTSIAFTSQDDVVFGGSFSSALDFGDGTILGPTQPHTAQGFLAMANGTTGSCKASNNGWAAALCQGSDTCNLQALAIDPEEGDIIAAGSFHGTLLLAGMPLTSTGTADAYLVQLDPTGTTPQWTRQYGSAGTQATLSSVALDKAGNPVVAGSFTGSVNLGGGTMTSSGGSNFIASYTLSNGYNWSTLFDISAFGTLVRVDSGGNVVAAGGFMGSVNLGGGPLMSNGGINMFVGKLSSVGAFAWNRAYGAGNDTETSGLALTPEGAPVVVGRTNGAINFGDGPLMWGGGDDAFVATFAP
jgi:hypothetical protein